MSIDSTLKASKGQEQAERSLRRTLQQLSSRTVIQPNWLLLIPPYDTVLMNSYSIFFKCSEKSRDARLTEECMSKDLSAQELSNFYEKVEQLVKRTHTAPSEQEQSTKLSVNIWELLMFDVMDRNAQLTQWEEAVGFGSADACRAGNERQKATLTEIEGMSGTLNAVTCTLSSSRLVLRKVNVFPRLGQPGDGRAIRAGRNP